MHERSRPPCSPVLLGARRPRSLPDNAASSSAICCAGHGIELLDAGDGDRRARPPRRSGPGAPWRRRRPCRCKAPRGATRGRSASLVVENLSPGTLDELGDTANAPGGREAGTSASSRQGAGGCCDGPGLARRWKYCAAVVGWATVRLSLGADREEALQAGRGVLRALPFVAVREEQSERRALAPLVSGRGEEVVDDRPERRWRSRRTGPPRQTSASGLSTE